MNNFLRAVVLVAVCIAAVLLYYTFAAAVVDMQAATLAAQTARHLAEQQTQRVHLQEWNATLRSAGDNLAHVVMAATLAGVLVVAAVQAGRTLRHQESERTRRVALLRDYIARYLPAGARAEVITHRGDLAVVDHERGEIIPYPVAQLEMAQARQGTGLFCKRG